MVLAPENKLVKALAADLGEKMAGFSAEVVSLLLASVGGAVSDSSVVISVVVSWALGEGAAPGGSLAA